ncbi:phenoloxidase-activating factor 3-like [Episyrphus balteatus]|uniref:phenoloxidase-activating factor 3-like n=1 Tax=Episyrphus balteatus TaxID=286459 RepID=UPI002486474B|nr:phenoloxidase-activating factor 3-like [Episyrphus balteatus]
MESSNINNRQLRPPTSASSTTRTAQKSTIKVIICLAICLICLQDIISTCQAVVEGGNDDHKNVTKSACKSGECVATSSCQILRSAMSLQSISKEVIDIVKQQRCGNRESRSVCCSDLALELVSNNILANVTDPNSTRALVQLMTTPCGISDSSNRILNGETAFLFEFPWMALLEFNTSVGRSFMCAGSLISDRYVLTAAHCFVATNAQLVSVRLGEHDTSKEIDCEGYGGEFDRECAPPVQNHKIDDVIIHNDFRLGIFANDIALIRLQTKVAYEDTVIPICLPISKDLIRNLDSATVAGWGLTVTGNTSNVLQKAQLPVLANDYCGKLFARNFTSAHICAGGRQGVDTCKGDAGGPLFARTGSYFPKFVQYGILSGGGMACGGNSTIPSIYTNVVDYVPWIIKNIRIYFKSTRSAEFGNPIAVLIA